VDRYRRTESKRDGLHLLSGFNSGPAPLEAISLAV
jgi:hypothetical protein